MLYLAVAQSVALVLALAVVAALSHRLSAQNRSHARRVDALLDRLLHATGKTWTPPPAEIRTEPAPLEEIEALWTASPEQLPV